MLLAPAIASPHYFPGAGTISSTFIHIPNVFYHPANPVGCSGAPSPTISSSAIYMFLRFHLQRFICFSELILSDLYLFPISSSAIYMFLRFHPQRFICFSNLILRFSTPGLCCFALAPLVTSAGLPYALLRPLCALGLEMLQNDPLGASWDNFASWRWKCLKSTLWMPPGTTLRARA